jgi:hypothetical protein
MRPPKWSLLFTHLKSGVVKLTYIDRVKNKRESQITLVTGFIPEKLQKKQAPNNPADQTQMTAFDLQVRQWVTFDLETIEEYVGLVSYTAPRQNDERPRPDSSTEEGSNEGTEEEGNARKFRSRFDPEA